MFLPTVDLSSAFSLFFSAAAAAASSSSLLLTIILEIDVNTFTFDGLIAVSFLLSRKCAITPIRMEERIIWWPDRPGEHV